MGPPTPSPFYSSLYSVSLPCVSRWKKYRNWKRLPAPGPVAVHCHRCFSLLLERCALFALLFLMHCTALNHCCSRSLILRTALNSPRSLPLLLSTALSLGAPFHRLFHGSFIYGGICSFSLSVSLVIDSTVCFICLFHGWLHRRFHCFSVAASLMTSFWGFPCLFHRRFFRLFHWRCVSLMTVTGGFIAWFNGGSTDDFTGGFTDDFHWRFHCLVHWWFYSGGFTDDFAGGFTARFDGDSNACFLAVCIDRFTGGCIACFRLH